MQSYIARITHYQATTSQKQYIWSTPYYSIDPTPYIINPIDMYKEALITFSLSI